MKMICDLIVADQPTINGRTYTKEMLELMNIQMNERIVQGSAQIYNNLPDYTGTDEPPNFDKIIGNIVECKLSDRLETVCKFNEEYSKIISNEKYEIIPVGTGEVVVEGDKKIVKNYRISYCSIGIKGRDYRIKE